MNIFQIYHNIDIDVINENWIFFFFFQDSGAGAPADDDEAARSCKR